MAQNFFRSYGNSNDEIGRSVVEAKDTSFLIFGSSSSFIDGTSNFYLMNIDSLGNFKWSKTYGGNSVEQGRDICLKPNGHFLLTGFSNSFGNGYEVYNVEVDSLGNEIWSKTYGGSDWDFAYSNLSLPNGDVLITGNTYSFGNGNSDGFLMQINNLGDSLWWKNYGTAADNVLRQSILTTDNEILSIGYTITQNGDKDFYLVKCNLLGDTIWTKTYGSSLDDEGFSIIQSINGNYILAGYTEGFTAIGSDGYYFEVDTSGVIIWTQIYGSSGEEIFNSISLKPNEHRFYAAWETTSFGSGGYDFVVNSLYTNGGWNANTNTYGTLMMEKPYDVIFTSNKRILTVGFTDSPYGNQNIMAIMSDTLMPTQSTMTPYIDATTINETVNDLSISIYPNPANQFIHIKSDDEIEKISILDLTGKMIGRYEENFEKINVENLNSGIYIMNIEMRNGKNYNSKISITKL